MQRAFFRLLSAAALLLAAPLAATPTRIAALDDGNLLAADDWDATYFYSLSPNFRNHVYFDRYSDGTGLGWAFLDLKLATLVLWWNKPFEAAGLYSAAVSGGSSLGYGSTAFATDLVNAWEPREKRLAAPDNKVAIGLAAPLGDSLSVGFCFRWATLDGARQGLSLDGGGNPSAYGASTASLVDGTGSFYTALNTFGYDSRQSSSGLVLSPQFSWFGERATLSVKGDLVYAGADNSHTEDLTGAAGRGWVRQGLKEKGTLSWGVKPHLRWALDKENSLVLRGSWDSLGFDTEHRITGHFDGAGFSAIQAAGYDHVDAAQTLRLDRWEALAGWVKTFMQGRSLVLLGAGAKGESSRVLDESWQIRASPSSYDDLVRLRRVRSDKDTLALPVLMGAEIGIKPWLKARGMVTRNFYGFELTKGSDESWSAAGTATGLSRTEVRGDGAAAWKAVLGFGLDFGSFAWDMAVNGGLLGSATGAAIVNPLYQSSLSYGW